MVFWKKLVIPVQWIVRGWVNRLWKSEECMSGWTYSENSLVDLTLQIIIYIFIHTVDSFFLFVSWILIYFLYSYISDHTITLGNVSLKYIYFFIFRRKYPRSYNIYCKQIPCLRLWLQNIEWVKMVIRCSEYLK